MMSCPLSFMVEMVNTELLQSGFTESRCVHVYCNKRMTAAAQMTGLCISNH